MSQSVVIDTNAYSSYKRGEADPTQVVLAIESIIISPVVLGELFAGFELGRKMEQNKNDLQEFLAEPNVLFLTINAQTSEAYASIFKQLRKNGTPIPTNDIWIAAMALQLDIPVFTYDTHFEKVEGLKIVRTVQDLQ